MLDLSPFYTHEIVEELVGWGISRKSLSSGTFARDVYQATEKEFDLRGLVTMSAGANRKIPVNKRFSRFHAVHATWNTEREGMKIGAYMLHYADGEIAEVPLRYGEHLRDVWAETSHPAKNAITAWTGKRLKNDGNRAKDVQFFGAVFENPRPEEEVVAIDLVSFKTVCIPFFLAITLEQEAAVTAEFEIARAREAEKHGNITSALAILDEAVQTFTASPGLWSAKGRLFDRAGRTNEAIEAYTKAIEMAAVDTNAFLKVWRQSLLQRSGLFLKMGRYEEAGLDNCRARNFPLRNPQTPPELLDLGAFCSGSMSLFLGSQYRERLNTFLLDVQRNTGVEFDARGYVGLYGRAAARDGVGPNRRSVTNILVNRHCTKLHVLHTASYGERKGARIGSYILRFADGQSQELPIIYGEHVRSERGDDESVSNAIIAWTGVGAGTKATVFMTTWANPRPLVEVKSLDFVSAMSESSPILIAITVE